MEVMTGSWVLVVIVKGRGEDVARVVVGIVVVVDFGRRVWTRRLRCLVAGVGRSEARRGIQVPVSLVMEGFCSCGSWFCVCS